jgi:hypothetical protein
MRKMAEVKYHRRHEKRWDFYSKWYWGCSSSSLCTVISVCNCHSLCINVLVSDVCHPQLTFCLSWRNGEYYETILVWMEVSYRSSHSDRNAFCLQREQVPVGLKYTIYDISPSVWLND